MNLKWLFLVTMFAFSTLGCLANPISHQHQVERLANLAARTMPINISMRGYIERDPSWLFGKRDVGLSKSQTACIRQQLTVEAITRRKIQAARRYGETLTMTRLLAEIAILERGGAEYMAWTMAAVAEEERTGVRAEDAHPDETFEPSQVAAFESLLSDKTFTELRKMLGISDTQGFANKLFTDIITSCGALQDINRQATH
jgi:hypothetical protein